MWMQFEYLKPPFALHNPKVLELISVLYRLVIKIKAAQKTGIIRNTGVVKRINAQLGRFHLQLLGLQTQSVGSADAETLQKRLANVRAILAKMVSMRTRLEEVKFFNNEETEGLMDAVLEAGYDLEFKLKKAAFKGAPRQYKISPEAEVALRTQREALA